MLSKTSCYFSFNEYMSRKYNLLWANYIQNVSKEKIGEDLLTGHPGPGIVTMVSSQAPPFLWGGCCHNNPRLCSSPWKTLFRLKKSKKKRNKRKKQVCIPFPWQIRWDRKRRWGSLFGCMGEMNLKAENWWRKLMCPVCVCLRALPTQRIPD